MSVSKEKMDAINKDFEKLNANLEGLNEEELKEVSAGLNLKFIEQVVFALGADAYICAG